MTDTEYHGWTNWETWLTNLHFDDAFTEQAQECWNEAEAAPAFTREENAALALADIIKETVEYVIDETMNEKLASRNMFIHDILDGFTSSVNWREIAKNYISAVKKESEAA